MAAAPCSPAAAARSAVAQWVDAIMSASFHTMDADGG